MAEGHQAVAFSFAITHEGLDVDFDFEVLRLIFRGVVRSWRKRTTTLRVSLRRLQDRKLKLQFSFYRVM